jgi:hypothetical protein
MVLFSFLKTSSTGFCIVHPTIICSASLQVCHVRKVVRRLLKKQLNWFLGRFNRFWNRFTEQLSQTLNREPLWWKPVQQVSGPAQPVFSQNSPTATSFWGLLYIPLTFSLFIHFCPIHDFLADLLSNKSIQSTSHTQNRISFN